MSAERGSRLLVVGIGVIGSVLALALVVVMGTLLIGSVNHVRAGAKVPTVYGYDRALNDASSMSSRAPPARTASASIATRSRTAIGGGPSSVASAVAAEGEGGLVDLTDAQGRSHILDGEIRPDGSYSGGHRPGTGFSGKSEFPSGWTDDQILHEISDVATDPASMRLPQGSRTIVTGNRGGVDIRVVIDNPTGRIVTGYPTNLPKNP